MSRINESEPADLALPEHERRRLIALVTGQRSAGSGRRVRLTASQQAEFDSLAVRRQHGEPLQYLEGTVQFGQVEIVVDSRVLIPRPETEYLLELVGNRRSPTVVVDLCTGSGALALALKQIFPNARVVGSDISADAIDVATINGLANGLSVEWYRGDLFAALPRELAGKIELLVANPPYVAEGDWTGLPDDVLREPRLALVAGTSGMEIAERLLRDVHRWLSPSGEAWVEVGEDQARDLADRFSAQVLKDQYGRDRYVRVDDPVIQSDSVI
jgi:release factor glutamine methyltransferase